MIRVYAVTVEPMYDGHNQPSQHRRDILVRAYDAADAITQVEHECKQGGYWCGPGELRHYHNIVLSVRPSESKTEGT